MKPKSQDIAYYIYLDVLSVQKAYGPCPISCFTQNSLIARARNMGHPVVSLKTMSISSPTLIYFLSIFNFFSLSSTSKSTFDRTTVFSIVVFAPVLRFRHQLSIKNINIVKGERNLFFFQSPTFNYLKRGDHVLLQLRIFRKLDVKGKSSFGFIFCFCF